MPCRLCHLTNVGLGMRIRLMNDSIGVNIRDVGRATQRLLSRDTEHHSNVAGLARRSACTYAQIDGTCFAAVAIERPGFGAGPYSGYCYGVKKTLCARLYFNGSSTWNNKAFHASPAQLTARGKGPALQLPHT